MSGVSALHLSTSSFTGASMAGALRDRFLYLKNRG